MVRCGRDQRDMPEEWKGEVAPRANLFGPLAHNGGPTETTCDDQLCPTTDQRGMPSFSGPRCIAGAVQPSPRRARPNDIEEGGARCSREPCFRCICRARRDRVGRSTAAEDLQWSCGGGREWVSWVVSW